VIGPLPQTAARCAYPVVPPSAHAGTGVRSHSAGFRRSDVTAIVSRMPDVPVRQLLAERMPAVIGFVLLLTIVVLVMAFRSLTVALTAAALNLLSVGAAYGLLVLVFPDEWAEGRAVAHSLAPGNRGQVSEPTAEIAEVTEAAEVTTTATVAEILAVPGLGASGDLVSCRFGAGPVARHILAGLILAEHLPGDGGPDERANHAGQQASSEEAAHAGTTRSKGPLQGPGLTHFGPGRGSGQRRRTVVTRALLWRHRPHQLLEHLTTLLRRQLGEGLRVRRFDPVRRCRPEQVAISLQRRGVGIRCASLVGPGQTRRVCSPSLCAAEEPVEESRGSPFDTYLNHPRPSRVVSYTPTITSYPLQSVSEGAER